MGLTVRPAVADDVACLAALGAAHRRRLAGWSPTWWHVAAGADAIHPLWLGHLVGDDGTVVRVVEDDGDVVGGAVSVRQPEQWFVDDVVLADDAAWPTAGTALLRATEERPALTCVPHAHTARVRASEAAGLDRVSTYWIRSCGVVSTEGAGGLTLRPVPPGAAVPPAPRHTFGALDPGADGALAFAAGAGIVVGSPSVPAPPVYDPGGTVVVVDRVAGGDRAALLRTTLTAAAARGDVLVAVVAAHDDEELEASLATEGFDRTVDVYALT